ncbi:putative CCR4-associated factor 1-like protein 11 [Dichanthelium oligosanthes]|uniref:poly(A)-specific ribonuclease n=1 Tax=Dichanthelium oligosanthes TaxID=888268 RepID=A0A1E5VXC9_9POAL|nr:putative CCR4-associated factor 1-like protein 11 [Dichanthelium oligosanthes]
MPSLESVAGGWREKKQQPHHHHHQPGLQIRQVWADNVDVEFKLIRAAIEHFPYVSMDTEFPGVIHRPTKHPAAMTPAERYSLIKSNVDALHLIQVGLTFAASPSSPPALAFEVNLREFDPRVHRHAPDSVRLLASSGLDLAAHRARGVSARAFAALLMSSGLVCNPEVAWVTFHSAYDFAYLIKLLMGRKLPRSLPEFLKYVRVYFGPEVYDVKHMMRFCGDQLFGGLERVAAALEVQRAAGRCHQAASDSVLTWDTFRQMKRLYFAKEGSLELCAGVLFGLELEDTKLASQSYALR